MARFIIFGDLHANWEAWLALQQAEPAPDAVFCLGDTVGYGPDPKRCLDSVRANASAAIRGVHDAGVAAEDGVGVGTELLAETWGHARSVLRADDRGYLAALPTELTISLAGVSLYLGRLSPDDAATETRTLITAPAAQLRTQLTGIDADILFLGGPHVPAMRQLDGRLIVCPGSLGQPRYGVADPTFAAWEDGRVQIHHLHYHPQDTIRKLSLLPLDPDHSLWLQSVLQTGGLG